MKTHWAEEHIGKPWVPIARGPDSFDCYGLLWWVYSTRYKIDLQPYFGISPKAMRGVIRCMDECSKDGDWIKESTPREGHAVGMSKSRHLLHVGIWLDLGKVLHAKENSGVVAQTISQLESEGYRRIEFYRHKDFV